MTRGRSAGSKQVLLRLLRDAVPGHAGQLGLAAVAIIIVAATTAVVAWLMKDAVNSVVGSHDVIAAWTLPALIVAVSAAKGMADYVQSVTVARVGNAVAASFQKRLFAKLLTFEQAFFDTRRSGQIAAQIANNTRMARATFVTMTARVALDGLTVMALVLVMVLNNLLLALLVLSISPIVLFGMFVIGRQVKALSHTELESGAAMQASAQEALQGIRTVRAYELEPRMTQLFGEAVDSVRRRGDIVAGLSAMNSPLGEVVGGLMIAATILVAGWGHGSSAGEVMSFVTAFLLAFQPAKRLMSAHIVLLRGAAAVSRIYELLDQPDLAPPAPAVHLERARGAIAFRDVTFGYDAKRVLDQVSFEAHPGETLALVGRSGAGKSTIFALLQGLYRPRSGAIELDGIDVANLPLDLRRRQFSVVTQNTTLFSTTIGENIRLARGGATDEEVEGAARAAGAFEFISSLPNGFNTEIGELGMTLSGGQVQRLSLARAILRDAPILLLDEATAALDVETADLVQANLRQLHQARTTLVIAHRPAMIKAADRVVVLANGKVVDIGSPLNLLQRSKAYRSLLGVVPPTIDNVSGVAAAR